MHFLNDKIIIFSWIYQYYIIDFSYVFNLNCIYYNIIWNIIYYTLFLVSFYINCISHTIQITKSIKSLQNISSHEF